MMDNPLGLATAAGRLEQVLEDIQSKVTDMHQEVGRISRNLCVMHDRHYERMANIERTQRQMCARMHHISQFIIGTIPPERYELPHLALTAELSLTFDRASANYFTELTHTQFGGVAAVAFPHAAAPTNQSEAHPANPAAAAAAAAANDRREEHHELGASDRGRVKGWIPTRSQ